MIKTKILLSVLPLFIFAVSCSNSDKKNSDAPSEPVLIGDYVSSVENYSKLNEALAVTKLSNLLLEDGDIMFFAPTNEAFEKIDPLTLELLFAQAEASEDGSGTLKDILSYHLVQSEGIESAQIIKEIESSESKNFVTSETQLGETLEIVQNEGDLVVNSKNGSAIIVKADIESINGVVHSIDTLLNPTDMIFPSPAVDESKDVKEQAEGAVEEGEQAVDEAVTEGEEVVDDVEEEAGRVADDVEKETERAAGDVEEEADRVLEDLNLD